MIETIYKVEDNDNKKPDISIRLPKNIKQIGQSEMDMNNQIYIEENVLAYIKQTSYKESQIRYGVLLGDKKQGNGYTYIFINGMVDVEEIIEDSIIFSDDVWTRIYDNIRRYYKEGIIVGWYASFDYDITKDMLGIRKIHLDHFAGSNKVFLNVNREDDDEAFYIYERNGLRKQSCYHVYFEKSEDFEDYIFGTGRHETSLKEKEPTAIKETGKYGIALNNNINTKEAGALGKISKEGEKLKVNSFGRVASFITIVALAGVIGAMGQNGGFDVLQSKVQGFVNGILDNDKRENDSGNIIAVDGYPSENVTTEISSEEESTTDKTTEMSETESTTEENSSQQTTEKMDSEITTSGINEEETTTNVQATLSGSNDTYATYTVKDGETLYSIAILFYGTADKIDDIMKLNNMTDENYIMEGQKILLP